MSKDTTLNRIKRVLTTVIVEMRCHFALLFAAVALLALTATPAVCSEAADPVPASQGDAAVLERSADPVAPTDHSSAFDVEDLDDDEVDDDDDDEEELVGRDVVTQRRRSKWDGIKAHVLVCVLSSLRD